tara:strand:+ start:1166 stop:1843 length:678 start_codon:yes stop_codon:yes gene_type:complete
MNKKQSHTNQISHGGVDLGVGVFQMKNLSHIFLIIYFLTGMNIFGQTNDIIDNPDLYLLGLITDKDISVFEKENSLYEKLKPNLIKLICTGSETEEINSPNGFESLDDWGESIQYFAFNDQYFFRKFSSKWILLDDMQINSASFEWQYNRINKPLGNKDVSFLSKDFNSEVHLGSVSEKLFINRETGSFYSNQIAFYIFPNEEVPDFEVNLEHKGTCKLPGKNKF